MPESQLNAWLLSETRLNNEAGYFFCGLSTGSPRRTQSSKDPS